MNLAFPEHWWWLLFPILLGLLAFRLYKRSAHIIPKFFDPEQVANYHPLLKFYSRILGSLFLFIACLGPYFSAEKQLVPVYNKEIMFVLDVSASMNCQDVAPSRLQKAKYEIKKMLKKLEGCKMGLIVFTSFPFVQAPLTKDIQALELFLDLLETHQFANTGTDFRKALLKAYQRFLPDSLSQNHSKTIVFISDGEDFGEKHQSVIEVMKQKNIHLYAVGVGTRAGAPVPNPDGGFFKLTNGQPAYSRLNPAPLRYLANQFKTPYFELSSPQQDLSELATLLEQEKYQFLGEEEQAQESNLFVWFLFPGTLFWAFSFLLVPYAARRPFNYSR